MTTILNFDTIHEYNTFLGIETFHPLISSIDFSKIDKEFRHVRKRYGFYFIFLKQVKCGDLIKKETGKTAQEYVQLKIIDKAKDLLYSPDKSINEIAYGLGFKYPHHFSRMFKKIVGVSPTDYRLAN